MKTILRNFRSSHHHGLVAFLFFMNVLCIQNTAHATTFIVNTNDGGWPAAGGAGTLNKAISDFNAAGAGSHIIDIQVDVSMTNPAFWAINNASATLTINGNNHTVDGAGYSSWSITVGTLIINDWTMTSGFGGGNTNLGGSGGHIIRNCSISNVAFNFTKDGNSIINSSILGPGATYVTLFTNSNNNIISGSTFYLMAIIFSGSSGNAISTSQFSVKSGISFTSGSNNNTVYGCTFNLNSAGTVLVPSTYTFDITISASTGNIIGSNTAANRNVFALSSTNSVVVGSNCDNTQIVGNYFGTDITGTIPLAGSGTNSTISITKSKSVIVDYNVLSSMNGAAGGAVEVVSGDCSGIKIRYNKIGVDVNGAGTASGLGNGAAGIVFSAGTVNNVDIIGNTIARSKDVAIKSSASGNPVNIQDNFIGSNSTGLYDVSGTDYGNGHGAIGFGGGTLANVTITGNVIVRNGWLLQDLYSCGILVQTPVTTISITNNKIGVYSDNTFSAPSGSYSGNAYTGVLIYTTASGITISNNVICQNGFGNTKTHGIAVQSSISNATITNNYIGITPNSVAAGNGNSGIDLQNLTTATISGNYIGANEGRRSDIPAVGIAMSNGTNLVSVTGNFIGVMPNGTAAGQQLNGSYDGSAIRAEGTASKIIINNNDLANSAGNGVNVIGGADFIQIFDNRIYCNTLKGINLNCSGTAPDGPGNNSFGCGTITLNTFSPLPTTVSGGRPTNSVVYVYGTHSCAAGACGTSPQGQNLFTGGTMTYPTGTTWNYAYGSTMYNDITALAVGQTATGNCSGSYCRTSEFTNCVDNTLPVSLLYFKAEALDKSVFLSWSTATEQNNAYFIIERSSDGKNFEPIENIKGQGNSSKIVTYEYTDNNVSDGTYYYRLKQVDVNGDYGYSEIKQVTLASENIISIYPNPNNGSFTISATAAGNYEVSISNILGQVVYSTSITSESLVEKNIQTSLAKGTYIAQISSSDKKVITKLIVE